MPVPPDPGLVGARVYLQYLVAAPGGPLAASFALSEGLEVVVGP